MNKKYESEALQVIHEDMKGMHQLGIISDTRMREFDEMCLTQKTKTPQGVENLVKMKYSHATA